MNERFRRDMRTRLIRVVVPVTCYSAQRLIRKFGEVYCRTLAVFALEEQDMAWDELLLEKYPEIARERPADIIRLGN